MKTTATLIQLLKTEKQQQKISYLFSMPDTVSIKIKPGYSPEFSFVITTCKKGMETVRKVFKNGTSFICTNHIW